MLRWEVVEAESISLNQGIGRVDGIGTTKVSPSGFPTTYILTASNADGTVTERLTVRRSDQQ